MSKKKKNYFNKNQILIDFDVIEKDLFLLGDLKNIKFMLPKLFDSQHEDVAAAERRFKNGKGYLFTNGTGTGKTFVGLGIAKRFYIQGKKDILIVVPTDKKSTDWVEEGKIIDLNITKLSGVNDKGHEVTVTTYANFYQNDNLNTRHWDLLIYDESHYLNQNEKGDDTCYLARHKELSNVPSQARLKAFDYPGVYTKREVEGNVERILNKELFEKVYNEYIQKTKVVFLSATPFAYHKSIKYADGCLFEINEKEVPEKETSYSYNEPSGFQSFLVQNFGYRMMYNKVTIPESGVDVNLLERSFFESNREKGVMSTRQLDLDYDYSRGFITINSEIGKFIDDGLNLFRDQDFQKEYPILSKKYGKKFNYNYLNQLLECVKAKEIHRRIDMHLKLNRKIVVFHNYNNSNISHPFRFYPNELLTTQEEMWSYSDLVDEIQRFESQYPKYYELDLSDLNNTRESIKKHFSSAREFNGTISKKLRETFVQEFNTDNSFTNILIVQIKAGKEGISLHDKTGVHQRVLINLGLPTAPTDAIQTEGRIYREGLKSNAIYEYITLQTDSERFAFATKIAERSKTAENLAMGNLARDLEIAFKEGYINSSYDDPGPEQGTGGKQADKFLYSISEFDKAKTFYWQRLKKTSKNKAKEGVDYFATPEPLGKKIVDWLQPTPNEKGLEPSAGHGAIARWFPGHTVNHFIEPSFYLSSELAINSQGTIHNTTFEQYYIGNKYNFIAMNPPFGSNSKTAFEHVAKACNHLAYSGSRLIAIIPNGVSMTNRLDNYLEQPTSRNYVITGEILLPTVLFERAGTSVSCRIIRIEYLKFGLNDCKKIDLSYIKDINEFFNEIETLNF